MFEFNGKQIKLEFDYNSMCEMEDIGLSINDLQNKPLNMIRFMIYNSLRKLDKKITQEEAGKELMEYFANGGNLEELTEKISKAVEESGFFPKNNK